MIPPNFRLFHRGGPVSIPGKSVWLSWWKKWHWDRFIS